MSIWQKIFLWLAISVFVLTCLFPPRYKLTTLYRVREQEKSGITIKTVFAFSRKTVLDKQWYPLWEKEFLKPVPKPAPTGSRWGENDELVQPQETISIEDTADSEYYRKLDEEAKMVEQQYLNNQKSYLVNPEINWSFLFLEWAILWSIGIGAIITAKEKAKNIHPE